MSVRQAGAASPFFAEGSPLAVLTGEPLGRVLDYKAPPGGAAQGAWVEVPLGPRRVLGVVWGPGESGLPPEKLRSVAGVLDLPPLRAELRAFLQRAADYTLTPLSAMLRLATRAPGLLDPPAERRLLQSTGAAPARATPARTRALEALAAFGGAPVTARELASEAGVSPAVLRGLVKDGALQEIEAPRDRPYPRLEAAPQALEGAQAEVATALREAVAAQRFQTTLLCGVTGSGKTEVYLEAVAACLAAGRQALVLLPEIALTSAFLARVEARFGARPGEWHSGLTASERRRLWRMTAEGGVQLVVGARSALFLPFADLGLIVVDEEHDGSYKQEEGVIYHARDMAVLRGAHAACPVVLASATPSLETWANAKAGRYARLDLPARFGAAEMPDLQAIDLRGQALASGEWISPALWAAVDARLARGEQALLFLNRRGYAPVTLCRACGAQVGCPHCDARMVEHRFQKRLICHQCGTTAPIPTTCPSCKAEGRMAALGPGVERLAEEVARHRPGARLAVLASDLFPSARALKAEIDKIAAGEADIIIGTQIVAKGHDFPHLTLVGVVDADLGLQGSDLRAAERSFQLIQQVAGRAGRRAGQAGLALLQTHQPEHPVMRALLFGDAEGFWATEAAERQMAGMPPYGRLAALILSSPDAELPFRFGQALIRADGPLRQIGAEVFGPAPAPIARIRGRHRVRLLVKAEKGAPLQAALSAWLTPHPLPRALRLAVDIDPQSFL